MAHCFRPGGACVARSLPSLFKTRVTYAAVWVTPSWAFLLAAFDLYYEFIRHFGPLHLWKPFQTQRGSKTLPVCPNCKITGTFRKKLHAGMEGGRCPLRSRAPRNRANCAPVGMVLDSPSPTRAKGGGGRQATPTVSPFVCVSLVSVVD